MAATALYGRGMNIVDLMLRNRLFSILRILITARALMDRFASSE